MMTRRQFAALISSAAVLQTACTSEPTSEPVSESTVAPTFDRIDTHFHIHRVVPNFLASMAEDGWGGLDICVSRSLSPGEEVPPALADQLREAPKVAQASNGRIAWAASFDSSGFESPDFSERTIADLQGHFDNGAIAAKMWKNVGMALQSESGEYLLPDNAVFTPIFEAIEQADRTLYTHLAEPDGAWQPLDDNNRLAGYLGNNPLWHMLNHPNAPSKEVILAARDRVLERHPGLRVVGAHIGSMEEHLPDVARHLDMYPNFVVDVASRVGDLINAGRDTTREFMIKYQDRVLYASDYTLRDGTTEEDGWNSFKNSHDREWNYFSSTGMIDYRNGEVEALGLPEEVLRKIFHDNAVKWLPGIAG